MWTLVNIPAERRAITLALCALLLAGCQNPPPRKDNLEATQATIASAQATPTPVPEEVSRGLVPTLTLDSPATVAAPGNEQRFEISVNEVPARQFFMSLVDGTHYNIVVHPDVTGKISLSLKNVTIPEVIAAARDVYGYEFQRTSYGFEIMPARLDARVYQINYLNMNRSGASSTFVSAGTLQRGGDGDANRGVGQNGDTEPVSTDGHGGGRNSSRSTIGTQITTRQPETSFWQELQASVSAIIGEGNGHSVVVNPQSGVIVVRALPTELREVETFLQAAQLIAQRQVVLEAKILEVELSDGFQSGINWASVIGDFTLGHTGGGTVFPQAGVASDNRDLSMLLPQAASLAVPASGFGGVFSLALQGKDFGAFLELLKTQGNVQVLSSPRISTMNNQKAVIKVGTDEFFVTDVSTTTVTGTSTTSTPNIELTPFFSGIALDVTPQISRTGDVMLHIHPSVSEVTDQQKAITVGGVQQTLPLARSTVRESDSIVKAMNGQLVVIGGLMQNHDRDLDAKTPGLGELPMLGALFRHRQSTSRKSELVILLRPIVIETPDNWATAFESPRQELESLGRNLDDIAARQVGANIGIPQR